MYAIVDIAGQQYKVEKDQKLFVHRLVGEEGKKVSFDRVLLLNTGKGVTVGDPLVKGASVSAIILSHMKADKILVFKKKRRKGYQKLNGHRQYMTQVQIENISEKGVSKPSSAEQPASSKATSSDKKPAAVKTTTAVKKPAATKEATAAKKPAAVKATTAAKKPAATRATTAAKKPAATKEATAAKKPAATKTTTAAKKPAATRAATEAKQTKEKPEAKQPKKPAQKKDAGEKKG